MYSLNNLHQVKEQIEIEDYTFIENEFLRVEKLNQSLKLLEKSLKEIDSNYSISLTPYGWSNHYNHMSFNIKLSYLENNLNEFTTNSKIKLTNEYYSIYKEDMSLNILMRRYDYEEDEEEKVETINFETDPEKWMIGVESILISNFLEHYQIKRRLDELTKKLNKNCSNKITI